ncbi:MAG: hypothetical protein JNN17_23250 [Verrucomicrobiaceae bacterium]|nr:hypothetical protein [Verrucomicrobiaceae bacterium]
MLVLPLVLDSGSLFHRVSRVKKDGKGLSEPKKHRNGEKGAVSWKKGALKNAPGWPPERKGAAKNPNGAPPWKKGALKNEKGAIPPKKGLPPEEMGALT